jgi:hypothetical protein
VSEVREEHAQQDNAKMKRERKEDGREVGRQKQAD